MPKFLLRNGGRFTGGRAWTLRHDAWLRGRRPVHGLVYERIKEAIDGLD
jgi:hypothetical protein